MPRTKLDRFSLSKTEIDARLIKSAMADAEIFTNRLLAEKIGCNEASVSRGFKKGFSEKMKLRIIRALSFTVDEKNALMGW